MTIVGDAELLTQMVVNLVENSLRHTPAGARVKVGAVSLGASCVRFYRLEHSHSTPGSGLGLSLVAAVAKLHQAHLVLADAGPGLEVQVRFERRG